MKISFFIPFLVFFFVYNISYADDVKLNFTKIVSLAGGIDPNKNYLQSSGVSIDQSEILYYLGSDSGFYFGFIYSKEYSKYTQIANTSRNYGKFSKSPGGEKFNFSYTSLNQLKEVKIYASDNSLKKTINYFFDPQGRRIKKAITDHLDSSKSFSRSYLYDGEHIIAEFDGAGNKLASYTHSPLSPDDILSSDITSDGQDAGLAQTSGKYYYLKDHLGSMDVITDRLGNTVQKYQYSSFGKIVNILDNNNNVITSTPKVNTSFTYTGREFDSETGLYFYRARNYDPSTGRFLQQDPHPGKLNIPITVTNKYQYVGNMPTFLTDPSGKFWPIIIGAIIGAVIGAIDASVNGGNFLERVLRGAIGGALFGAAIMINPVAGAGALAFAIGEAASKKGNFFKNLNDDGIKNGAFAVVGATAMSELQAVNQVPFVGSLFTGAVIAAGAIGLGNSLIGLNNAACDPETGGAYRSDMCSISRSINGN